MPVFCTYLCPIRVVWALLLLVQVAASAQAPRQFFYNQYDNTTGLPANNVTSVVQDKKGYLWLATINGLARFDGKRYKVFRHKKDDPYSLPFNSILSLNIDKQQRLWVMTSNYEVGYFDTATFRFYKASLQLEDNTLASAPKGLSVDEDGNILLGVGAREVLVLDEKQALFVPATAFFPKKPGWHMRSFVRQPGTQKYWVFTQYGLTMYNRATGVMAYKGHNPENDPLLDTLLKFPYLNAMVFDSQNRLWFSSTVKLTQGLFCYNMAKSRFDVYNEDLSKELNGYHEIWEFWEQSDGTIWVRGNPVLAYFDPALNRFVHIPPGPKALEDINYSSVSCLYEDREHNIWVGTDNNGVYRFNPSLSFFSNIPIIDNKTGKKIEGGILSFMVDRDSSLLFSAWSEGVFRLDRHFNQQPFHVHDKARETLPYSAWGMCKDPDGEHVWMACQPGILKYNMKNRSVTAYNPAIFDNRTVRQVVADASGNLWFGTQGLGLIKWRRDKGAARFEDGLYTVGTVAVDRPINKILVDSKNLVWVGTSQHGLYVVNPSNDQVVWHFQEKTAGFENLPEQGISSVLEYNDSLMLFTTSTFVLQFNRITRETTVLHSQETISGFIASLIKDREGNVWMGTTTGLYRFHPFKKVILSFNRQDGLFNDQFEGDAVAHLPDGQLVFGASSQLVVFDPVNVKTNSGVPQITITNIAINNKNLLVDSLLQLAEITLSPEENALTIDFSPLLFSNWHAIQYKMEGADKDWILADKNMQAVYTYLPPGEYRFYFRTIDTERNVSADQYQFTIVIHPPFYRAWWFYLLLLVMAGVLLFWFDQERMKRKEAVIQVRNKIADDLHKEVNTALQNINILSEMANIKAENDAQKAKEFITQIHQKSNTVIDSMEDVLWGLSPENDSMLKMVHRMEESVAHFNARYDTSIELLVNDMVKRLVLDMRIRYEVFLLFKESVQGLLTVCPEGFKFHITVNKNQLLYTVYGHNNPHTEIQLANLLQRPKLVQRVEAIGAEWTVQPGKIGFVFDIKIPLKG